MSLPLPFERPEATTWSVDDVLRRARDGRLFVPVFQRNFQWDAEDVRKLFDSIYRGYPIGNLLLWETERTGEASPNLGPVKLQATPGRGYLIIDGQQRITSLVGALLSENTSDPRFRLFFDLRRRVFTNGQTGAREEGPLLPLPETADTLRYLNWLQGKGLSQQEIETANHLVRSLRDYRIPIYIVTTQNEKHVREIFERMNTTGKQLKATDIFAALQRGRRGKDLQSLTSGLTALGFGQLEEEWVLKAVAALLNLDVTRRLGESLREVEEGRVQRGIADAEQAIPRVIRFLREDAAIAHIDLLPYRFPLVPLAKLFHLVPEPKPSTRERLVRWIWRGAWSEEHGRSDAPTIRAALKRVTSNEETTVDGLLDATPQPRSAFSLAKKHDFRAASTKLVCAVLAMLKPLDPVDGTPIDVAGILDSHGADAYRPIFRQAGEVSRGTQNRWLVKPRDTSVPDTTAAPARELLANAPQSVLESHCIPARAVASLQGGDSTHFLEERKSAIEALVRDFLELRA